MTVRLPILSPERINPLIELAVQEFEDSYRLGMQNLAPNGRIAGQEVPELLERGRILMQNHDRNLALAQDPNTPPGLASRVNGELQEEQQVLGRIFG